MDKEGSVQPSVFWEAVTHQKGNLGDDHVNEGGAFNPKSPVCFLTPQISVVLAVNDVVEYLEHALSLLTLTTSMQTESMCYWMKSFEAIRKSGLDPIALSFVPQEATRPGGHFDGFPSADNCRAGLHDLCSGKYVWKSSLETVGRHAADPG